MSIIAVQEGRGAVAEMISLDLAIDRGAMAAERGGDVIDRNFLIAHVGDALALGEIELDIAAGHGGPHFQSVDLYKKSHLEIESTRLQEFGG